MGLLQRTLPVIFIHQHHQKQRRRRRKSLRSALQMDPLGFAVHDDPLLRQYASLPKILFMKFQFNLQTSLYFELNFEIILDKFEEPIRKIISGI